MEQVLAHRTPLMLGGAIALAVALIGSILAGLWVSRWSLGPLEKLERFLVGIDTEHPEQGPSLVRSGLREVDSIGTALEDLLARLSDELVRSRRFSADAAHELRTPLSKIRTELELVEEEAGAETRMAIRRAVAKTDELTVLMDRLLVLASPGDVIRDRTLTALSVVFETVVEELEPTVASRVRLELDADGLVVGNQAIFRSVASNAIENAAKYSEGEIRVRVWEEHEQVVVRVDDDGPGLGKDERLRAFEPFYRGVLNRATPGTGIGLALIAHVVRSHHGTARFLDSELGAKLELRLPAHLG